MVIGGIKLKINKNLKEIFLRWILLTVGAVIGQRTSRYKFNFSMIFSKEFFGDMILVGLCAFIVELIFNYNTLRKKQ